MSRSDIWLEISMRWTLNLPAMAALPPPLWGDGSSTGSIASSATSEMTDIRCDLPVP